MWLRMGISFLLRLGRRRREGGWLSFVLEEMVWIGEEIEDGF